MPLDRAAVDGFVFWTRNLGPFEPVLDSLRARGFPFVVQYTITGYPRQLDAGTIEPDRALGHLRDLARRNGPRAGVWRYDPIVFSSLTPPDWHRATFARLARDLAGTVDEAVVSFLQVYRKTARNMAAAAEETGFGWRDPDAAEKRALLADLAEIAAGQGMRLALCAQPELLIENVREASCIDAGRLSDLADRPVKALAKPHRKTCACHASRDIGDYDTCPHGCVYCYAVRDRTLAKRRFRAHDPEGEFLFTPAGPAAPPVRDDGQGTLF